MDEKYVSFNTKSNDKKINEFNVLVVFLFLQMCPSQLTMTQTSLDPGAY